MDENKKIAEMYWVLTLLRLEWEEKNIKEDFDVYAKKRVWELYKKAFDWLLEDYREELQKI